MWKLLFCPADPGGQPDLYEQAPVEGDDYGKPNKTPAKKL